MALVKLPAVRFATDQSMATIAGTSSSEFRGVLDALLTTVAAGIISGNATVVAAAEAAVANALSAADVLVGTDVRSPKLRTDLPGYTHAFVDSAGRVGAASMRRSDMSFDDWVIDDIRRRLGVVPQGGGAGGLASIPILAAHLAQVRGGKAVGIGWLGSSTTANNLVTAQQGYVWQTMVGIQKRYPASGGGESDTQHSTTGDFTLRTAPGAHGYNAGVGGTTSANYAPESVRAKMADLGLAGYGHMIGSNDYFTNMNPSTYRANLETVLDDLDARSDKPVQHVLFHAYQRYDYATRTYPWESYGNVLRGIADERENVTMFDLSQAYEAIGIPNTDPLGFMAGDNTHQYAAGHRFMADLILSMMFGS